MLLRSVGVPVVLLLAPAGCSGGASTESPTAEAGGTEAPLCAALRSYLDAYLNVRQAGDGSPVQEQELAELESLVAGIEELAPDDEALLTALADLRLHAEAVAEGDDSQDLRGDAALRQVQDAREECA